MFRFLLFFLSSFTVTEETRVVMTALTAGKAQVVNRAEGIHVLLGSFLL
jgi:hypothetical protein